TKLGRGLSNVITFPMEIPEQISRVNNTDGPFAGITEGLLKGLGSAVGRMCIGLYETVTFMSPGANEYKPILSNMLA
ncbi:MAG: exosortase system-associated protein, TIGR04073 family, partial [Candidatus Omnitrophota bacterium]|nr:exosortase system-associated protein, TIGR04073 family [Candidatus Omnitrophota bacterium]